MRIEQFNRITAIKEKLRALLWRTTEPIEQSEFASECGALREELVVVTGRPRRDIAEWWKGQQAIYAFEALADQRQPPELN